MTKLINAPETLATSGLRGAMEMAVFLGRKEVPTRSIWFRIIMHATRSCLLFAGATAIIMIWWGFNASEE